MAFYGPSVDHVSFELSRDGPSTFPILNNTKMLVANWKRARSISPCFEKYKDLKLTELYRKRENSN